MKLGLGQQVRGNTKSRAEIPGYMCYPLKHVCAFWNESIVEHGLERQKSVEFVAWGSRHGWVEGGGVGTSGDHDGVSAAEARESGETVGV